MVYHPIDTPGFFYMKLNQRLRVGEYRRLCRELTKPKYAVVRASEGLRLFDQGRLHMSDRVRVIWIHDIEWPSDNYLAEEMARVEKAHGLASTWNIRMICALNEDLLAPLRRIVKLGGEIQYQYEDLVAARGDARLARKMFGENLKRLRRHFPKINIAFAHGVWLSGINSTNQFKSNGRWRPLLWTRHRIHPLGELYYFMDVAKKTYGEKFHYIGESGCLGADEFLPALRSTRAGDVVMLLQHPGWWSSLLDMKRTRKLMGEHFGRVPMIRR